MRTHNWAGVGSCIKNYIMFSVLPVSWPRSVSPKHIWVAEKKYGLGVADPQRIEIVRVGSMENALI